MRDERSFEDLVAGQRDHEINNKIKELGGDVFADAVLAIVGKHLEIETEFIASEYGFRRNELMITGRIGKNVIFQTSTYIEPDQGQ